MRTMRISWTFAAAAAITKSPWQSPLRLSTVSWKLQQPQMHPHQNLSHQLYAAWARVESDADQRVERVQSLRTFSISEWLEQSLLLRPQLRRPHLQQQLSRSCFR